MARRHPPLALLGSQAMCPWQMPLRWVCASTLMPQNMLLSTTVAYPYWQLHTHLCNAQLHAFTSSLQLITWACWVQAADAPEAMDTSGDPAQPAEATGQAAPAGNGAVPPPGAAPRVDEPSGEDPETLWAGRLLSTLTRRKPAPVAGGPTGRGWTPIPAAPTSVPVTYEDVVAWMEAAQVRTAWCWLPAVLRACSRAYAAAMCREEAAP
jgi:hypothetical protein